MIEDTKIPRLEQAGEQAAAETPHADGGIAPLCARCRKPPALCVCAGIAPLQTRVALLILQHPQEQDKMLGSAHLAALHVAGAAVRVGLSWPSLARAVGRPADPRRWATLYLGAAPDQPATRPEITVLDGRGRLQPNQATAMASIEGIVVLDGTWSQAKTLWWRNPWLLKGQRLVLQPRAPSRYGALRREPRAEGLSTLEAAAMALSRLEQRPEIEQAMVAGFERLLGAYRMLDPRRAKADPSTARPQRTRPWRVRGGRKA